ncbi:uncharacterized protein LOC110809058 [Carica papaya]|uniref:uncharacterized protein LOC110809058 n=1 Tax=Carica papaya TaxID=3649 RepID=UPI000B8CF45F|nr:uncharacterized protein LOC110809058 [Carica papaya]
MVLAEMFSGKRRRNGGVHCASKPSLLPTQQSNSPIVSTQLQQQSLDLSFNPFLLSSHLAQPGAPFWLPQRPAYPFSGLNPSATFQPFTPIRTINAGWQALDRGENSARNQTQFPSFCYHVGYTFPGFPGSWDPSYCWAQNQRLQPSCTTLPGPYGYFSSPLLSPIPSCSPQVQSSQKGIIRPTTKLSQKHQHLWEAQSAENVQLWNFINQLQSEVADYKNRLTKLEEEISCLKPRVEELAADHQATATGLSAQPSKRRRPKRSLASADVHPPFESYLRARGRRPASSKLQSEARTLAFEKVRLNKVEDKEKRYHPVGTLPQQNNWIRQDIARNFNDNMDKNRANLIMSAFSNQIHHGISGIQTSGIGLEEETKAEISKPSVSILSQQVGNGNNSATYMGTTSNGSHGIWPSSTHSEEGQRNTLYINSQAFSDSGSTIRQGERKANSGWSFVNEEEASEELEAIAVGSSKEENEEEMGDDGSSSADEMGQQEAGNAYNMDGAMENSRKGLPQFNNW